MLCQVLAVITAAVRVEVPAEVPVAREVSEAVPADPTAEVLVTDRL